jgi:hypothetical protein
MGVPLRRRLSNRTAPTKRGVLGQTPPVEARSVVGHPSREVGGNRSAGRRLNKAAHLRLGRIVRAVLHGRLHIHPEER